jgi:hypothetical protein
MTIRTITIEPYPDETFAQDAKITCKGAPFLDPNRTQIGEVTGYDIVDGKLYLTIRMEQ